MEPTKSRTAAGLMADGGGLCVSQGALDRIRTYDLLLRRQTLYPLSYEGGLRETRTRMGLLKLSRWRMAPKNALPAAQQAGRQ